MGRKNVFSRTWEAKVMKFKSSTRTYESCFGRKSMGAIMERARGSQGVVDGRQAVGKPREKGKAVGRRKAGEEGGEKVLGRRKSLGVAGGKDSRGQPVGSKRMKPAAGKSGVVSVLPHT